MSIRVFTDSSTSLSSQFDNRRELFSRFNVILNTDKTTEICGSALKTCYWLVPYGSPRERTHISSSRNGRATGMEAEDWLVSVCVFVRFVSILSMLMCFCTVSSSHYDQNLTRLCQNSIYEVMRFRFR